MLCIYRVFLFFKALMNFLSGVGVKVTQSVPEGFNRATGMVNSELVEVQLKP